MVIGVGLLLLLSMLISAALSAAGTLAAGYLPASGLAMQVIDYVVPFAVIAALFALIFHYLPDTDVQWQDVWPGAAITAVLFILGQLGIGLYLGRSAVSSTYGAAGSLAVILLWVYYSAQIVLLLPSSLRCTPSISVRGRERRGLARRACRGALSAPAPRLLAHVERGVANVLSGTGKEK